MARQHRPGRQNLKLGTAESNPQKPPENHSLSAVMLQLCRASNEWHAAAFIARFGVAVALVRRGS